MICAFAVLTFNGSLTKLCKDWSLLRALTFSGLPAAIYALQNSLLQISYKNLDSLTFSMLNQTKLFFTAFFGFVILRYSVCNIAAYYLFFFWLYWSGLFGYFLNLCYSMLFCSLFFPSEVFMFGLELSDMGIYAPTLHVGPIL